MKALILALFAFVMMQTAFAQPVASEAQYSKDVNELVNPGFEQGLKGWTSTAGTFSATAANGVDRGARAGCVSLTAQTLNLSQIIPVGNLRGQGEISAEAYSTIAGTEVCSVVDGVDRDCTPVENLSSWTNRIEIGFVAGSTDYGIRFKTAGNVTGIACLDTTYAGKMPTGRISEVGAVGPWIDYGPITIGATTTAPTKGTPTTDKVRCRQMGSSYECNYKLIGGTGTAGTGDYLISLPTGIEFDSSLPNFTAVGNVRDTADAQTSHFEIMGNIRGGAPSGPAAAAAKYSSNQFRVSWTNLFAATGNWSSSLYDLGTRRDVDFTIKFRGAGLNSRVSLYSQQCRKPSDCENSFSARVDGTVSPSVVSNENTNWINGNCTRTGTGIYDCPLVSNLVSNVMNCSASSANENTGDSEGGTVCKIVYSLSSSSNIRITCHNDGTASTANALRNYPFTLMCQKGSADYKGLNLITGTFEDAVKTPGSSTPALCSAKISSAGIISDQQGACFASCTNANPTVCSFNSDYWSVAPSCTCIVTNRVSSGDSDCASTNNPTTTTADFYRSSGNAAYSAGQVNVVCHGKKL